MMRDLAALRRGRVALRRDGEANQLSFSDRGMLIDDRLLTKLLWPPILPVTGNPRCRSGRFDPGLACASHHDGSDHRTNARDGCQIAIEDRFAELAQLVIGGSIEQQPKLVAEHGTQRRTVH